MPVPRLAEIGNTSSTASISPTSASTCVSSAGPTRSTLFTAQITGARSRPSSRWPAMNRSPGPIPCSALTTKSTTSAPSSSCSTRRCMRSVSTSRGRWTPGRSTSTSCHAPVGSVATPRLARRVVCGRSEMIATFAPTIALTSVDLPTFGRPARPANPERVAGAPEVLSLHAGSHRREPNVAIRPRGSSRAGACPRA